MPIFAFLCSMVPSVPPTFFDHILVFLIAVVLPAALLRHAREEELGGRRWSTADKVQLYRSNSLFMWGVATVILVAWLLGERSLAEIGFRAPDPTHAAWWKALVALFVLLEVLDVTWESTTPHRRRRTVAHFRKNLPFLPETRTEFLQFQWMVLSASFSEEIIFRGFFTGYLLSLTGDTVLGCVIAAVFPAVVFGLTHIYQGWKGVWKIIFMGSLLGGIVVLSHCLWLAILLHAFVDFLGGLVAWRLLAAHPPPAEEDEETKADTPTHQDQTTP